MKHKNTSGPVRQYLTKAQKYNLSPLRISQLFNYSSLASYRNTPKSKETIDKAVDHIISLVEESFKNKLRKFNDDI